jgi:hypothetical protein
MSHQLSLFYSTTSAPTTNYSIQFTATSSSVSTTILDLTISKFIS